MKLQIGDKIRQLRQRDGRTQEMVACAIGVTGQAVSRWEAGGGYPDMEILPVLAHYFHVSIDELFGYDGDREKKIQEILEQADEAIRTMSHIEETIARLRSAVEEFPSEVRLWLQLGNLLVLAGFNGHGVRRSLPEKTQDGENMTEYNLQNHDIEEALKIYEKILPDIEGVNDRVYVIKNMVRMYGLRGEYEKAEKLAGQQNPVQICRECLLPLASNGAKRVMFEGEALLELAWQMTNLVLEALSTRYTLRSTRQGMEKGLAVISFYKGILEDGNYGFGHYALTCLYGLCAQCAQEQGLLQEQSEFLQRQKIHLEAYRKIREQGGEFVYTSVLTAGVTARVDTWPPVPTSAG